MKRGSLAVVLIFAVVLSTAATEPMLGGSGRFSDISSEYCPLVSPSGRSVSSKRRASALAARCK